MESNFFRNKLPILLALLALFISQFSCQTPLASNRNTLTVLAGSELRDLEPLFGDIRKATGITLEMHYIGTLEGAEKLMAGEAVDLAWFSHTKYILLLQGASGRVLAQEKIMLSPVVLGVKENLARQWGWVNNGVARDDITWRDISQKVAEGELRFAMTNPTTSNTGFTALVGAAAAFSDTGDALTVADVDAISDDLSQFFKGQALTAGSSGWLAERYVEEQDRLDGMINYESVLLSLNQSGDLYEPFTLIYPQEGIITADYPLMLVNEEKRTDYNKLVEYLRSPDFQKLMMERTLRRPVISAVPLSSAFPSNILVELPFPNSQEVVDHLLFVYLDKVSVPTHSYFVLDVSGSMDGERLDSLKSSLVVLTGVDESLTGQFARFRDRERVTLITFSDQVQDQQTFEIKLADPSSLGVVQEFANGLHADGRTAIYDSLRLAYEQALADQQAEPDRYYTIVLMSDGENNTGQSLGDFLRFYSSQPGAQNIKTFAILFGEADEKEMTELVEATGGRLFDAKNTPLETIFKQIRGYQ
jgi:Ca-activated chloride channel homolog